MATQASKASSPRWPPVFDRHDPCARDSNDGEDGETAHPNDPDGEIPRWSGFVWIPLLGLATIFCAGFLSILWSALS